MPRTIRCGRNDRTFFSLLLLLWTQNLSSELQEHLLSDMSSKMIKIHFPIAAFTAAFTLATLVYVSSHANAQTQTPVQQAAAALVGAEKCGGSLSDTMNKVLAVAVQTQGTAAINAAKFAYRSLWTEAGLDTDPVLHDAMCAQLYRNGWLQ